MPEYISIGYLKKPFGVKGEIKVKVEEEFLEDFLQASILFLKINGKPVPYFVEKIRVSTDPLVKFEDVDTKEAAVLLSSTELLLREQDRLPEASKTPVVESLEYAYLKGYLLRDEVLGDIGTIQSVEEFPQQEMAVVAVKDKEVLIPLNEHFLKAIDKNQQTVLMQLPEGLI